MKTKSSMIIGLLIGLTLSSALWGQSRPPVPKSMPGPEYPYEMSRAGVVGAVTVEFIITTSGSVVEAGVIRSTHREFESAAIKAVRSWKFTPGEKDGRKVNVKISQTIEFHLDPSPVYPRELLVNGVSGTATVEIELDSKGQAIRPIKVEATRPEFGHAAVAAAMAQQYAPDLKAVPQSPRTTICKLEFKTSSKDISKAAKKLIQELAKGTAFSDASELDQKLKYAKATRPRYPAWLAQDIRQGTAVIEVFVNESGEVLLPRIISATEAAFGYAAMQAVAGWTYEPPKKNGQKVTAVTQLKFEFKRP